MLERLRKHVGARSDADLARRTGLSNAEVSRIGSSQRGEHTKLSTIRSISKHTNLPMTQLVDWWAEEQPEQEQTA